MNTAVVGPPTPPSLGNMPGGMPLAQPNQFIKVCNTLGHGVGHVKLIEEKGKWFLETQDKKKTLIFTPGPSKNNKVTNPRDLEAVVSYANKAYRNGGVTGKLYPLDLSPQNPFQSAWNALQKGLNEGKKAVEGALQTPVPGTNNLPVGKIVSSVIPIVGPVANATEIAKKAIPAVQNAFSSPTPPLNGATTGSQVIEILKTAKQRAAVSLSQENIKQGKVASYAELKRTLEETEAVYAKHGKTWDASSQENYPLLLNSVKSDLKKMVDKTQSVLQTLEAAQQAFTANPSAANLQALKNAQSELTSRQRAEAYAPDQEGRINRALAAAKTASAKNTVPDQLTQALAFYRKNDTAAARGALNEAVHSAEKGLLPKLNQDVQQAARMNGIEPSPYWNNAYTQALDKLQALKNQISTAKKLLQERPRFNLETMPADGEGKGSTYVGVNISSNRGSINSKLATEGGTVVTELRQARQYLGDGKYKNLGWRGVGVWVKNTEGRVLEKNTEKIFTVPTHIKNRQDAEVWLEQKMREEFTAGDVGKTQKQKLYEANGGLSGALKINLGGTEGNLQILKIKGQDGVKAAQSLLGPVGKDAQRFSLRHLDKNRLSHPNEKTALPGEDLYNEVGMSKGLKPNSNRAQNGSMVLFEGSQRDLIKPDVDAILKAAGTKPPMVGVVPVYVVVEDPKKKGSYISARVPLYRVTNARGGDSFVQDGRIYKDFNDWKTNNKLPVADILVPPNGFISRDVKGSVRLDAFHNNSPKAQLMNFGQLAANLAVPVGLGVSLVAPYAGGALMLLGAVGTAGFSVANTVDRTTHGQAPDPSDVINVLAIGAGGAAMKTGNQALQKTATLLDLMGMWGPTVTFVNEARKGNFDVESAAEMAFYGTAEVVGSLAGARHSSQKGRYAVENFRLVDETPNTRPQTNEKPAGQRRGAPTSPKTQERPPQKNQEPNVITSRLGKTPSDAPLPDEQILNSLTRQYLGENSSVPLQKSFKAKVDKWVATELEKPGQTRSKAELLSDVRSSPRLVADWLAKPLAQSLLRDAAIGRNAGVGKDALENALARRIAQQYSPELSRKLAMKDSQTSTQLMRAAAVDVFVQQTGAHRPSVEQYLDGRLAGMNTSTRHNYLAGLANPQNKNERQRLLDYLKREFGTPEQNVPPKGKETKAEETKADDSRETPPSKKETPPETTRAKKTTPKASADSQSTKLAKEVNTLIQDLPGLDNSARDILRERAAQALQHGQLDKLANTLKRVSQASDEITQRMVSEYGSKWTATEKNKLKAFIVDDLLRESKLSDPYKAPLNTTALESAVAYYQSPEGQKTLTDRNNLLTTDKEGNVIEPGSSSYALASMTPEKPEWLSLLELKDEDLNLWCRVRGIDSGQTHQSKSEDGSTFTLTFEKKNGEFVATYQPEKGGGSFSARGSSARKALSELEKQVNQAATTSNNTSKATSASTSATAHTQKTEQTQPSQPAVDRANITQVKEILAEMNTHQKTYSEIVDNATAASGTDWVTELETLFNLGDALRTKYQVKLDLAIREYDAAVSKNSPGAEVIATEELNRRRAKLEEDLTKNQGVLWHEYWKKVAKLKDLTPADALSLGKAGAETIGMPYQTNERAHQDFVEGMYQIFWSFATPQERKNWKTIGDMYNYAILDPKKETSSGLPGAGLSPKAADQLIEAYRNDSRQKNKYPDALEPNMIDRGREWAQSHPIYPALVIGGTVVGTGLAITSWGGRLMESISAFFRGEKTTAPGQGVKNLSKLNPLWAAALPQSCNTGFWLEKSGFQALYNDHPEWREHLTLLDHDQNPETGAIPIPKSSFYDIDEDPSPRTQALIDAMRKYNDEHLSATSPMSIASFFGPQQGRVDTVRMLSGEKNPTLTYFRSDIYRQTGAKLLREQPDLIQDVRKDSNDQVIAWRFIFLNEQMAQTDPQKARRLISAMKDVGAELVQYTDTEQARANVVFNAVLAGTTETKMEQISANEVLRARLSWAPDAANYVNTNSNMALNIANVNFVADVAKRYFSDLFQGLNPAAFVSISALVDSKLGRDIQQEQKEIANKQEKIANKQERISSRSLENQSLTPAQTEQLNRLMPQVAPLEKQFFQANNNFNITLRRLSNREFGLGPKIEMDLANLAVQGERLAQLYEQIAEVYRQSTVKADQQLASAYRDKAYKVRESVARAQERGTQSKETTRRDNIAEANVALSTINAWNSKSLGYGPGDYAQIFRKEGRVINLNDLLAQYAFNGYQPRKPDTTLSAKENALQAAKSLFDYPNVALTAPDKEDLIEKWTEFYAIFLGTSSSRTPSDSSNSSSPTNSFSY